MINLLNLAAPIVGIVHPNIEITCRRYVSSTKNDMGVVQPVWEEFVAYGQVQPQTANDIKNQINIDVSELKLNIWIKAELHTVDTQAVGDQIVHNGKRWNVSTVTNWNPGNGWGNYVVTEDKYVDPATGKPSGTVEEEKDGLQW